MGMGSIGWACDPSSLDFVCGSVHHRLAGSGSRGSKPQVRALAWFVDRPQGWPDFALRNMPAARADIAEEFKNPANRSPGPTATMPPFCPAALDFAAIRGDLNQQGQELAFVKIGLHAGTAGNHNGLGEWEQCLDAAGVPFFLKSVDDSGKILEGAQLKAASGVPHTLVYRKAGYA